ncbi:MAG: DUF1501 domain-containing protein [Capsulimonadales bacterium]|nr:DUF1501 domain-containing protein [Capsulimonadales bacterium]
MNITRRLFLKNGGIALASIGLAPVMGPAFLRRAVFGAEPTAQKRKKTLICIFQRGAADGLSMVVPHGDPNLYKLRQNIAIPRPAAGNNTTALDLDGFFGLHPALAPFLPIYKAGHLAVIHACGSPHATRSHFDAQDYMESAAPGNKSVPDGWLARAIQACPEDRARLATPLRAVAIGGAMPRSLQGDAGAIAIPDLRTFGVGANLAGNTRLARNRAAMPADNNVASGFETLYDDAVGDVLHGTGKESFEAIHLLKKIKPGSYVPERGATYPAGRFGDSLKQIAQLIKGDVGVEVAFAEIGGWDTHANQGAVQGQLAGRLREFASGITALYADLGDRMADVAILTMSEFGRTARQNGTGGTDHGHATCFFALGGDVNGGKVLGTWPGLAPEQLNENRDLALTTDFRVVFAEMAQRQLGAARLEKVFPGFQVAPADYRRILRG